MWIKKIASSLYLSLVVRILLSAFIASITLFGLSTLSNKYVDIKNIEIYSNQQHYANSIANSVQHYIEYNNKTFKEIERMNFDDNDYQIRFADDVTLNDSLFISYTGADVYTFDVTFSDTTGKMFIKISDILLSVDIFNIISVIVSIIIFFCLSLYLVYKQLSYINVIESGIKIIADEDMLYKIPIKGNNELAKLALNINNMGDTIYQSHQKERKDEIMQRQLITNMSHDLKTPLTSMTGYIDIISNKVSNDEELSQYANIAKQNGIRLEKLINDIFLYSKLISGDIPLNLQQYNIFILMNQILEIRTENINFINANSNDVLNIKVDAEKFHRIIDNLLSNANKYGIKDSSIEIEVKKDIDDVTIIISNQTNDDLSDKMDKITNRSYTANEDRSNGSSGLGLSIALELISMMNGNLDFEFKDQIFKAIISFKEN